MLRRHAARFIAISTVSLFAVAMPAIADSGDYEEDGKFFNKDDEPTYRVKADGTVDWYTYSGFRRYHSECHVCHGPDGLGSTYAPGLIESMKTLSHSDFQEVVINGRERISAAETSKMPAFGENVNVTCYLDDIYVYLRARADDKIPRGRPRKRDKKPETAKTYENDCRGDS